jgi:hypothetical protein
MTPDEVLRLAALLSRKIMDRRPEIQENTRYYKGTEGRMKFASDEFRDYFARRFAGFSDNWCMPVAQAPIERANHLGIRLPGEKTFDSDLARMWERNDADRGLSEALLMMTIAKRSFGLVSPTPVGARITFENPDSAAIVYDAITRERKAGLAIWQDDTTEFASLYLPNSVLSLKRDRRGVPATDHYIWPAVDGWTFDDSNGQIEVPNPLGVVPLVEFRNQALLDDDPISDIAGVKAMQDSINLVWAYLLNALDYASLPARVVTGADVPKEPILDEAGQIIGDRPIELDRLVHDRITFLPGDNTKIAEWTAANLDVYSKVIEHAIEHVAAQTRTPAHYLIAGGNTPATGYELSEAGLVSKASERINYATPSVRELYRLSALAEGDTAKAAKIAEARVLWKKPQFRSESQLMDGLGKMRAAGFPFQWIAEEYGLSPADVDRVMEMVKAEQADPYAQLLAATDAAAVSASVPAPMMKGAPGAATAAPVVG